ncbi:MAG: hypothetical protein KC425_19320, partial [Anaerolineales bacterium]|nr:hypothetical protein [Anaerolineales bacterium]
MNTRPSAHARLRHVAAGLFLGFGLVALALIFWSALRAGQILAREDNPRLVEAALRVQRGQILDRNGLVLAETVGSGRDVRRVYPITGSGPAVGYYSFRHGAAGVEESYDDVLRGANEPAAAGWWRAQLHQPQVGQAVQTTLDAALQQQADAALGAHPGAVVLLDLTQPEIARVLALASHPGYDPNLLDAQFEALIADETAPLLNRAAQGQYQPGLVLQPFLWAAAYERGLVTASEAVDNANRPVPVNGIVTRCAGAPPAAATWGDALAQRCPGPMQALAAQFGAADFS